MRKPGTGVRALFFSCSSCTKNLSSSKAKDLLSVEPRRAQVLPCGVLCFNQRNFLSSRLSFNRLFASDGIVHILERFIVNETMHFVIAREARLTSFLCSQVRRWISSVIPV